MLYWDPAREMVPFSLPLLGRPILWYGFFFAFGFFCGYWILRRRLASSFGEKARPLADQITFYVILGTIIGARLGEILFYGHLSWYLHHPFDIFKVWEGGLASHGGTAGILIALWLLSKRKKRDLPALSFLNLIDLVALPTPLVACFIRLGNFFNQEILGKATNVPWAVTFGHPADGTIPEPRHPVQLYEALAYLTIFVLMLFLSPKLQKPGRATGLFLALLFGARFLLEFVKEEQSLLLSGTALLTMGQILSIPFIALGIWLFRRKEPVFAC